jgi:hypothetical protein
MFVMADDEAIFEAADPPRAGYLALVLPRDSATGAMN